MGTPINISFTRTVAVIIEAGREGGLFETPWAKSVCLRSARTAIINYQFYGHCIGCAGIIRHVAGRLLAGPAIEENSLIFTPHLRRHLPPGADLLSF
jgi:hypothetical protein